MSNYKKLTYITVPVAKLDVSNLVADSNEISSAFTPGK
jgi:hypothetical protein